MSPNLRLAFLALILPPLFWSGNTVLGRLTVTHVPPLTLNALRWGLAALLFAPFAYQHVKRDWPVLWQYRWRVLGLALCAATGYNSFLYLGLRSTSIVNAALINATTPAVVGVLSAVLLRNHLTRWQLIGAVVSMVGVLQIAVRGDWASLADVGLHIGDVYVFAGVVLYGLYTVLLRFAPKVHAFSFMQAIFVIGTIGTLVWMGFYALTGSGSLALNVPISQVMWPIVYMAIFASIGATFFWNYGVQQIGAIRAGYFVNLIPVFSIVWALLLIGEEIRLYQVVGMGLVCVGIAFALMARRQTVLKSEG